MMSFLFIPVTEEATKFQNETIELLVVKQPVLEYSKNSFHDKMKLKDRICILFFCHSHSHSHSHSALCNVYPVALGRNRR